MSMISATAGISSGLLYYYFKSKDELFTSLVQEAMFETEVAIRSIYELPGTPIQKLRALTTEILDESGAPYFMLVHQARTSGGVPEQVKQLLEQYSMNTYIEALLRGRGLQDAEGRYAAEINKPSFELRLAFKSERRFINSEIRLIERL